MFIFYLFVFLTMPPQTKFKRGKHGLLPEINVWNVSNVNIWNAWNVWNVDIL